MKRIAPGLVYAVTAFAYLVAVCQRSSLGVAGVVAAERFEASAAALSMLAVAQVAVYAGMQIPVGMLLDRFGSSRLIVAGTALMCAGQAIVAVAPDLTGAVAGRMLLGGGDAMIYVSGLRIVAAWFPPSRVPVLSQWYTNLGTLGQLLSAVPFAVLLGAAGWAAAFASLSALAALACVAALVVVHDAPGERRSSERIDVRGAFAKSWRALRRPGTRVGLWTHFSTQFPITVFSLLWGYPMMVQGLGIPGAVASWLLMVPVVVGLLLGPVYGVLTARFPFRRSNLVLGTIALQFAAWVVVLAWPSTPDVGLMVALIAAMGIGGLGASVAFDFARTSNPAHSFGSASGVVNVGGFAASFIAMFLIGVVVDAVGGGAEPSWPAYRAAMWVVPAVMAVGCAGLLVARGKARSRLAEEEGIVIGPLWVAIARRWRQRDEGDGRRG